MQWLEAFWTKEGKGIPKDAPKKTGVPLFAEIIAREWWELVKLNLLFLLFSLPLVTLPAALFATGTICRMMAEDRPVYLLRDFLEALRARALRATVWALVAGTAVILGVGAVSAYAAAAKTSLFYAAPLALSLVVTLFVTLWAACFVMVSVTEMRPFWDTLKLSALAALLRPLPLLAALAFVATLWVAHILFYPVSVFMPAVMNFSLGMFAVAFGAQGVVAQVLARSEEENTIQEP